MKKTVISLAIIAALAGMGWYAYQLNQNTPVEREAVKGVEGEADNSGGVAETTQDLPEIDKPRTQSTYYVRPETVPAHWEGFHKLSEKQQLDMVTEQMRRKETMDPELYAFLKAETFNKDHWNVTRNNIANALVLARDDQDQHPDPDLHEAFILMLEDEAEDPVWRGYCLQFLSMNIKNSSDPERVQGVIAKYSKGDDGIAGTAMVHMTLQERDGAIELDENFGEQLAEKLEKPEVHPDTKLTILSVMGTRKDVKQLPVIRKYAKQNEDAGLKRVAIAALGTIGASAETKDSITDEDRALVKAALTHKNGAVQRAAKAAWKKLSTD